MSPRPGPTVGHGTSLRRPPVQKSLALTVAALVGTAGAVRAQDRSVPLSADVALDDFGVTDVDAVVYGRVSIVHEPAGARLEVRFLSTSPAPDLTMGADSAAEPAVPPPSPVGSHPTGRRALWVWNTAELLEDPAGRDRFLSFVADQRIDRVFLYLPPAAGQAAAAGFVPFDGSAVGPLVAALGAHGVRTYALDGDPYYVRPENREGVLRTVRRVAEYNRGAPASERFAGVHYDVEPYLIPGFQGPRRAEILEEYSALVADLAEVAHRGGLTLGVDIPFWLDGRDEATGQRFEIDVDGARRPVLDAVLSHVDEVAVMAYRTTAGGPNGVVAQAAREVARASAAGVGVYVGLETRRIYDEEQYTFRGPARSGLPELADAAWVVVERLDGRRARVWYVEGAEALDSLTAATAGAPLRFWYAGSPVPLPGSALSFQSLGADSLGAVSDAVVRELGAEGSFRGVAFHDYAGMEALFDGEGVEERPRPDARSLSDHDVDRQGDVAPTEPKRGREGLHHREVEREGLRVLARLRRDLYPRQLRVGREDRVVRIPLGDEDHVPRSGLVRDHPHAVSTSRQGPPLEEDGGRHLDPRRAVRARGPHRVVVQDVPEERPSAQHRTVVLQRDVRRVDHLRHRPVLTGRRLRRRLRRQRTDVR